MDTRHGMGGRLVVGRAGRATGNRQQVDAIHRTGCDAQPATGALIFKHRVHAHAGADDGVHRTDGDAARAANTVSFADARNAWYGRCLRRHEDRSRQQLRQGARDRLAAWRTAICGCAVNYCNGVWPAAGLAALFTLSMRQQRMHAIDELIDL